MQVKYNKRKNSALEGIIEVIIFIVHILDADVVRFRHDPLDGIAILYRVIKSSVSNGSILGPFLQ